MTIQKNQISAQPAPMEAVVTTPVTGPGKGIIYPKNVNNRVEAFWANDAGQETQLTESGFIKVPVTPTLSFSNEGMGEGGVFIDKQASTVRLRTLRAGANVSISESEDEILIAATAATDAVTSASNSATGSGAGLVFKTKSGADLVFKKIKAGANVTVADGADDITISAADGTSGEANTASNVGIGEGTVFKTKSGTDLQFKTLRAGANVTVSNGADDITFSVAAPGEVNTASNLGTGTGLFASKALADLRFKSLTAGAGISLGSSSTEVSVAVSGLTNAQIASSAAIAFSKLEALTVSKALVSSASGVVSVSPVTATELSYLGGVTSALQTQLNAKAATADVLTGFSALGSVTLKGNVTIEAGQNVSLSQSGQNIVISSTGTSPGGGEANTASNSAAGTGTGLIFKAKVGTDLVFKKVKAGTNVTITDGTDDVTISATGSSGSSIETRLLSFDSGNIQVRATGTSADLTAVTATKNFDTASVSTLVLTKPTSVVFQSVHVTFTSAETTGRTELRLEAPDSGGATVESKAIRPFAIRLNSTYGIGATSSTFVSIGSGAFRTALTGYTQASEQKAVFLF